MLHVLYDTVQPMIDCDGSCIVYHPPARLGALVLTSAPPPAASAPSCHFFIHTAENMPWRLNRRKRWK